MSDDIFSTDGALVGPDPEEMEFHERMVLFDVDDHPLWREDDDDQELVTLGVSLRDWQEQAVLRLVNSFGSSKYEVLRKLWMHGIAMLDYKIDLKVWPDVKNYVMLMESIIKNTGHDDIYYTKKDRLNEIEETPDPAVHHPASKMAGELNRNRLFTNVIPDQKSRIQDDFVDIVGLGGWFNRGLICLGLSDSDRITNHAQEMADGMKTAVISSVHTSIRSIQQNVLLYVDESIDYWKNNGVPMDVVEDIRLMADFGRGLNSHSIEYIVDGTLDDPDIELIHPDEHGREPFLFGPNADGFPDPEDYYSWL
jgi:hypothetical protein